VSPGEGVAQDSGEDENADVGPVELEQFEGPAEPLELIQEDDEAALARSWYIIKVQVNREDSIRDALQRRVKVHGLDKYFGDIVVPTEDVAEFTKTGKRRIVKRKLYPGYIVVHMALNDDTWFLVRETPGIGDFTGSAGKPSPMPDHEIEKILKASRPDEEGAAAVRTGIPFKIGDRVRVKEGNFQNFEGDVASIDQANGRVTVTFLFFGRSTPIEIPHWQIEAI
jgi:transcriptional antiterminator NusG